MGGVIFMDRNKIKMWWFYTLSPRIDIQKGSLHEGKISPEQENCWILNLNLQANLQELVKSNSNWTVEHFLESFIHENCSGKQGENFATQHLRAYLYKIAVIQAGKLYRERQWQLQSSFGLWDIYQVGFTIACETTQFWTKYDSLRGNPNSYAHYKMEQKIKEEVFKLLGLKDKDKRLQNSKEHWILKRCSGKTGNQLKNALKFLGYRDFELERHLLAWKCFDEVYAPGTGEEHNPPTWEQLEAMAERYPELRRRSPELKQDNSQVNAEFIRQCLENAIKALKYIDRREESSYDAPLKNGEGTTHLDLMPEEKYNWEADATIINYYRAYSLNFQESDDLLHNLNSKEYGSLILLHVFGLSMDAIAELYQENKCQVSRRINKNNKKWLEEFCERQGMSQKAEELRAQKKLDANTSQLVNEVRKIKYKKYSHSQVYQMFLKIRQQLEPSSQEILESKHNLGQQLYLKLLGDHHEAQINSYRERLEKLLDVNWLYPEKILVSSGRGGRANANQISKKEQSISFKRGKIVELDNQRFVLMIEIKQGQENQGITLSFKLIPRGEDTTSLPSGLELALLNPSGKVVTSNTAKTGDNQLFLPPNPSKPATMNLEKLENNLKKGKVFQMKITLNGKSKTEPFPVL
jgi:hypothetical protein